MSTSLEIRLYPDSRILHPNIVVQGSSLDYSTVAKALMSRFTWDTEAKDIPHSAPLLVKILYETLTDSCIPYDKTPGKVDARIFLYPKDNRMMMKIITFNDDIATYVYHDKLDAYTTPKK